MSVRGDVREATIVSATGPEHDETHLHDASAMLSAIQHAPPKTARGNDQALAPESCLRFGQLTRLWVRQVHQTQENHDVPLLTVCGQHAGT